MATRIEESAVVESEQGSVTSTLGTFRRRVGIALVAAVLVNLLLLGGAQVAGIPAFEPLAIVPVTLSTVVAMLGGAVVYAVLSRFTTRANWNFTALATVVVLASAVTLNFAFTLPGATTAGVAVLGAMHLAAYAVVVAVLTDRRPLA
jgi:hypothetical protein